MQFTPEVVTAVGSAILTIGGMIPVLRKFLPKIGETIKQEAPVIAKDANAVVSFFAHLAESPLFAGVAAKGKVEAHHVISQLEQTHLALAAAKAVGVFNKSLNVTVDALSPTQKTDIVEFVRSELTKVGLTVTDAAVVKALQDAQSALDAIEKTVVPVVQQHVAAVLAWAAPTQA